MNNKQQPTTNRLLNVSSTASLKNTPTIPTGIIETMMAKAYRCWLFSLSRILLSELAGAKENNPLNIQVISLCSMTIVLSTVATCNNTVNGNIVSGSYMPNIFEPKVKCPLLLMGRYSVNPCNNPKIKASNHSII